MADHIPKSPAAAENPTLQRVQALLRKERKFLRRAVAAHRDVQAMFNALTFPQTLTASPAEIRRPGAPVGADDVLNDIQDTRMELAKAGLEASARRLEPAWTEVRWQTPDSPPPEPLTQERWQSSIPPSAPTWRQRLAAALAAWKRGAL